MSLGQKAGPFLPRMDQKSIDGLEGNADGVIFGFWPSQRRQQPRNGMVSFVDCGCFDLGAISQNRHIRGVGQGGTVWSGVNVCVVKYRSKQMRLEVGLMLVPSRLTYQIRHSMDQG